MNKSRAMSLFFFLYLLGCQNNSFEKDFFRSNNSIHSYEKLMQDYNLEDQYKLFIYGQQTVHPPLKFLAKPIAKKGLTAIDYVLKQINGSTNDLDYRDSMTIFLMVQRMGSYNICADDDILSYIEKNSNQIKDDGWKRSYENRLYLMCNPIPEDCVVRVESKCIE